MQEFFFWGGGGPLPMQELFFRVKSSAGIFLFNVHYFLDFFTKF